MITKQLVVEIPARHIPILMWRQDLRSASASRRLPAPSARLTVLGLKVSANAGRILFDVDSSLYPNMGWRSALLVSGVTDNIGSVLADFDILEVDITDPTNNLDNYLAGVDSMLQKVIAGAATLGAFKTRTEMQAEFARALMDAINRGVGQLVDADMDEASTRLTALQTQQQLAIQALQIANRNANSILRLFQ